MLSFKLRKPTHDKFSKVTGWLCLCGWLGGALFAGYTAVTQYLEARSVLEDHVVIPAALELVDTSDSYHRRAGTRTTYHFRYTFEFEGEEHQGTLDVSESNIDSWSAKDTIDIAYSTTNRVYERLDLVQRRTGLLGMIGSFLLFSFVMSILAVILYVYLTAKLFALHPDDHHLLEAEEGDDTEAPAKA